MVVRLLLLVRGRSPGVKRGNSKIFSFLIIEFQKANFNIKIVLNVWKCQEHHLYSAYHDTVSLFEYKYGLSSVL